MLELFVELCKCCSRTIACNPCDSSPVATIHGFDDPFLVFFDPMNLHQLTQVVSCRLSAEVKLRLAWIFLPLHFDIIADDLLIDSDSRRQSNYPTISRQCPNTPSSKMETASWVCLKYYSWWYVPRYQRSFSAESIWVCECGQHHDYIPEFPAPDSAPLPYAIDSANIRWCHHWIFYDDI